MKHVISFVLLLTCFAMNAGQTFAGEKRQVSRNETKKQLARNNASIQQSVRENPEEIATLRDYAADSALHTKVAKRNGMTPMEFKTLPEEQWIGMLEDYLNEKGIRYRKEIATLRDYAADSALHTKVAKRNGMTPMEFKTLPEEQWIGMLEDYLNEKGIRYRKGGIAIHKTGAANKRK